VEGLWLVKLQAVQGASLICVGVALSRPAGAVPELAVSRVARCQFVTGCLHLQFIMSIELLVGAAFTPVRTVMGNEG